MIQIRKALKSDLHQIVLFQLQMAMETENLQLNEQTLTKGVEAIFEHPEKGTYYIAETNGEISGMTLTTFEWSDWRAATILWIQSVFVAKKFRKTGIFTKLYNHIRHIAETDDNIGGIRLYVDKSNQNAIEVYKHLGMNDEHYHFFEWMTAPEDQ